MRVEEKPLYPRTAKEMDQLRRESGLSENTAVRNQIKRIADQLTRAVLADLQKLADKFEKGKD